MVCNKVLACKTDLGASNGSAKNDFKILNVSGEDANVKKLRRKMIRAGHGDLVLHVSKFVVKCLQQ